ETPERSRHELALQLRLGEARSWTHGYAATETGHAYARARELCERVGEDDSRGLLFLGLWASALNRGELRSAQELAEAIFALCLRNGGQAAAVWGHFVQGATQFCRAEMTSANQHLDRAIELYREEDHREALTDPGVAARCVSALTAWHLGSTERARDRIAEAQRLAERLARSYDLAFAHDYAGMLHVGLEEPDAVLAHAEALMR